MLSETPIIIMCLVIVLIGIQAWKPRPPHLDLARNHRHLPGDVRRAALPGPGLVRRPSVRWATSTGSSLHRTCPVQMALVCAHTSTPGASLAVPAGRRAGSATRWPRRRLRSAMSTWAPSASPSARSGRKPTWGVYWDWDPRLTTAAILLVVLTGYLALRRFVEDPERRATWAAVMGMVIAVDVPMIYFSVKWWKQPPPEAVLSEDGGFADGASRSAGTSSPSSSCSSSSCGPVWHRARGPRAGSRACPKRRPPRPRGGPLVTRSRPPRPQVGEGRSRRLGVVKAAYAISLDRDRHSTGSPYVCGADRRIGSDLRCRAIVSSPSGRWWSLARRWAS